MNRLLEDEKALRRLGARVQAVRLTRSLTQQEFAERAGFSVNYVGFIERGQRNPPYLTLITLARALGVRVAEFCADE